MYLDFGRTWGLVGLRGLALNYFHSQMRWDFYKNEYTQVEECQDLNKINSLLQFRTSLIGASLEKIVR